MAENSAISWTNHTFNPWIGCARVSPACDGCYAEALMGQPGRFGPPRALWGGPGAGVGTRSRTKDWSKPRKWNREAAAAPGETFVFCASLADVFDNAVPTEWRRDLFELISSTPNLTWLLLTKRPGNIVKLFEETLPPAYGPDGEEGDWYLPDLWPGNAAIGCTVVTQEEARRDIPVLLKAGLALKPAFTFVSMEPLLGPVDLTNLDSMVFRGCERIDALNGFGKDWLGHVVHGALPRLGWVIAGGETDQGEHKARPADPAWFRDLAGQCVEASVPFHFKQWGEWTPGENVEARGALTGAYVSDDGTWHEVRFTQRESEELHYEDAPHVWRVGKKAAGRRLDGVVHDARPTVAAG